MPHDAERINVTSTAWNMDMSMREIRVEVHSSSSSLNRLAVLVEPVRMTQLTDASTICNSVTYLRNTFLYMYTHNQYTSIVYSLQLARRAAEAP